MASLMQNRNFKDLQKIGSIGVYGSFSKGEDDKDSDIDLWIYTEKNMLSMQSAVRKLEKDMRRKVNLLILNRKKYKTCRRTITSST